MATLRELKGRIGSVASSEKITGAMKMISSAKMHRAEADLRKLLPFRRQIQTIIGNLLATDAEFTSPLTQERPVQRVTLVVLGSDDGLCGAYNLTVFKEALGHIASYRSTWGEGVGIRIVAVGSKIAKALHRLSDPKIEVETVEGVNSKATPDAIKGFTRHLQQLFTTGATDCVDLLYMNFQSVSRQRPRLDRMLPVSQEAFTASEKVSMRPCLFEPDAATIFRSVLPMHLMSMTQEVFTENRASEQAARIMAMQSANDNAKKLLEQLRLEYNKLRQQGITTELLDIVGGQARD